MVGHGWERGEGSAVGAWAPVALHTLPSTLAHAVMCSQDKELFCERQRASQARRAARKASGSGGALQRALEHCEQRLAGWLGLVLPCWRCRCPRATPATLRAGCHCLLMFLPPALCPQ